MLIWPWSKFAQFAIYAKALRLQERIAIADREHWRARALVAEEAVKATQKQRMSALDRANSVNLINRTNRRAAVELVRLAIDGDPDALDIVKAMNGGGND